MSNKISKEQENLIVDLLKQGMSIRHVCMKTNWSQRTVYRIARQASIKTFKKKITPELVARMRTLKQEGISTADIALRLNVGQSTVSHHLKKSRPNPLALMKPLKGVERPAA